MTRAVSIEFMGEIRRFFSARVALANLSIRCGSKVNIAKLLNTDEEYVIKISTQTVRELYMCDIVISTVQDQKPICENNNNIEFIRNSEREWVKDHQWSD